MPIEGVLLHQFTVPAALGALDYGLLAIFKKKRRRESLASTDWSEDELNVHLIFSARFLLWHWKCGGPLGLAAKCYEP
jgi:hypothetical protein